MSILNNIKYDRTTNIATFSMEVAEAYQEQAKTFFSIYEKDSFIIVTGNEKNVLKRKDDRICRFCGKSCPAVKFNKKAHFIPELLGNKSLLSDFECDSCNYNFGLLENEFANYLGPARTLSMQKSKKGVPTFKSPDKKLIIREVKKGVLGFNEDVFSQEKVDEENTNFLTLKYSRHPFCSLLVYKSLVKIGLSLIKEKEISAYDENIKFLSNKELKVYNNPIFAIHEYIIPGPHTNFPLLFSYKKKVADINELTPYRTFVLYFHTRMIQFFIPFDPMDKKINSPNIVLEASIAPPVVDQKWIDKYGKPISYLTSLDSITKSKKRKEQIKIRYSDKE